MEVNMKEVAMTYLDGRITILSDVCNGQPTIRGKRITVQTILGFLSAGESHEEVLRQYPSLEPEDIYACLNFATHLMKHKYVLKVVALSPLSKHQEYKANLVQKTLYIISGVQGEPCRKKRCILYQEHFAPFVRKNAASYKVRLVLLNDAELSFVQGSPETNEKRRSSVRTRFALYS